MRDTVKIDKKRRSPDRAPRTFRNRAGEHLRRIHRRRKQKATTESKPTFTARRTASTSFTTTTESAPSIHPETDFDTLRAVVMEDKDGRERWDLRVPTLDEYVRICKNYGKGRRSRDQAARASGGIPSGEIIDIIKAEDYLDGIIFIGFSFENMLNIRKMLPDQTVQFLSFRLEG